MSGNSCAAIHPHRIAVSGAPMFLLHCRMPVHPNIAQAVALDDRDMDKLALMYELAEEGDFTSYAWGHESVSVAVLMR